MYPAVVKSGHENPGTFPVRNRFCSTKRTERGTSIQVPPAQFARQNIPRWGEPDFTVWHEHEIWCPCGAPHVDVGKQGLTWRVLQMSGPEITLFFFGFCSASACNFLGYLRYLASFSYFVSREYLFASETCMEHVEDGSTKCRKIIRHQRSVQPPCGLMFSSGIIVFSILGIFTSHDATLVLNQPVQWNDRGFWTLLTMFWWYHTWRCSSRNKCLYSIEFNSIP